MTRLSRRGAVALLSGALGGCSGWFGNDEDGPPLPGTRKPVLLLEEGTAAEASAASIPVVLPDPVRNADWPMPGGNPRHVLQNLAGPSGFDLAWRADVGDGGQGRLAPPVVAGGKVITMDGSARVTAFDLAGGREVWRAVPSGLDHADTLMAGGVASDGVRVYACVGTGALLALDLATGDEIWRVDLKAPLRAGATVAGDRLVLITADNQTLCLSIVDGAELWRHLAFSQGAAFVGGSSPAIDDGVVISAYGSGDVVGLSLDTGQVLWSDSVLRPRRTIALAAIGDIDGLPAIDNGRVYVTGNGGETAAFDLRDGGRAWARSLASSSTPWIAGDFVWLVTDRGELVCLLRTSGSVRWVAALPAREVAGDPTAAPTRWAGPILAGGKLVVARSDGRLLALSPADGTVIAEADVGAPVFVAPIIADGTLLVLTESAELRVYR